MEEKHKCYYNKDSRFNPCMAMQRILDNSKEISLPLIGSFGKKFTERHAYVGWKGNEKNGVKGIAFNICPFCGEKILNNKRQLDTDKIPRYEESGTQ